MTRAILIAAATLLGCTPGSGTEDGGESGTTGTSTNPSTSTSAGTSAGESTTSTDPTALQLGRGGSTDTVSTGLDSSSDDGPACALPPVDEAIVGQLFIYGAGTGFAAVGESVGLSLAWIDFGFPEEIDACVEWSIDPVEGVAIDVGGVVSVEPDVAAGTIISVTADLEDGRRLITTELEVYVPIETPILGFWGETLQLPCGGGDPFAPEPTIPELVFRDTGEFTVTWTPFETYIDYWGTFTHDEGTGALVLTVDGGNYVPVDVDGDGTATVVDGELRLEQMWLGTAQNPVTPVACGHVFE